jgi:hypothetical protein
MARKTVDIEVLKKYVNDICKFSMNESRDIRQGAMNVLEEVLHTTGNYKGFRYLCPDEMEAGMTVGINSKYGSPAETMTYDERFKDTDNTRVEYH